MLFGKKWKKQLQTSLAINVDLLNLMDTMMQEIPKESKEKYDLAVKYIVESRLDRKNGEIIGLK